LEKVVLNIGLGRAMNDKKIIETAKNTLTKITGQYLLKPSLRSLSLALNSAKVT
ncbi:50S ribosomal protein L5, partial [Staphylococcus aureus]|uniref:50S ribosomal protein L5 n=1 Tax=Staphylococcus aureus TaxID=1280 RepID=UPI0039BEA8A0